MKGNFPNEFLSLILYRYSKGKNMSWALILNQYLSVACHQSLRIMWLEWLKFGKINKNVHFKLEGIDGRDFNNSIIIINQSVKLSCEYFHQ